MKLELTTDEYLQGLGIWTVMTQKRKEFEEMQHSLIKLLELVEDPGDYKNDETYVVFDYAWEDGTPMANWSRLIREQKIKVTGPDRKHV